MSITIATTTQVNRLIADMDMLTQQFKELRIQKDMYMDVYQKAVGLHQAALFNGLRSNAFLVGDEK